MDAAEWAAFRDRIATVAKMGAEDYGLTVGIHAHAAGFMDFEPELERFWTRSMKDILKICFDTGHHSYAGFDPVAFMERHIDRISYMHFKDIDPVVKADVIANRTGFLRGLRAGHLSAILETATLTFPPCGKCCSTQALRAGARLNRTATRRCRTPTMGDAQDEPGVFCNPSGFTLRNDEHDKTKWGMIGGGEGSQIGPAHRLGAQADGHFSFAAGALGSTPPKGRAYAQSFGVAADRAYGDWQEMLAGERGRDDRVDLVTVATPNSTHFEITKAFLEGGFQRAVRKADDDDRRRRRRDRAHAQKPRARSAR